MKVCTDGELMLISSANRRARHQRSAEIAIDFYC